MNVLIAYASQGGTTARIAAHIAERAQAAGHTATVTDLAGSPPPPSDDTDLVVICSAVYHRELHTAVQRFVTALRDALEDRQSALVSVSLAAALDDDDGLAIDDVDAFLDLTGFEPDHLAIVTGAWTPSQWDEATRIAIGTAVWRAGLSFDEDRDLTDLAALDKALARWW